MASIITLSFYTAVTESTVSFDEPEYIWTHLKQVAQKNL